MFTTPKKETIMFCWCCLSKRASNFLKLLLDYSNKSIFPNQHLWLASDRAVRFVSSNSLRIWTVLDLLALFNFIRDYISFVLSSTLPSNDITLNFASIFDARILVCSPARLFFSLYMFSICLPAFSNMGQSFHVDFLNITFFL